MIENSNIHPGHLEFAKMTSYMPQHLVRLNHVCLFNMQAEVLVGNFVKYNLKQYSIIKKW